MNLEHARKQYNEALQKHVSTRTEEKIIEILLRLDDATKNLKTEIFVRVDSHDILSEVEARLKGFGYSVSSSEDENYSGYNVNIRGWAN